MISRRKKILLRSAGVSNPYFAQDKSLVEWFKASEKLGGSVPSEAQQLSMDTLVTGLKSNGIWDKRDVMYLPANDGGEILSSLNLKDPSIHRLVNNNGVLWTQNSGYKTNGTDSYLDTGFTLLGKSLTATETAVSFWLNTQYIAGTLATNYTYGVRNGASRICGYSKNTPFNGTFIQSNLQAQYSAIDNSGFNIDQRSDDSTFNSTVYVNNTSKIGIDRGVTAIATGSRTVYIGCWNDGAPLAYNVIDFGYFSIGTSVESERGVYNTLMHAYMDSL